MAELKGILTQEDLAYYIVLVCLSQMSHVVWAFAYPDVHGGPSYNPGLVQTIVLMVPLAIYAIRTIYHEHYIGVVLGRPKLALIAASHLALTALPASANTTQDQGDKRFQPQPVPTPRDSE